ncbi:Retrovirus-related Pol polyprotein [Labeo rohita]|uniref:Retrovirus-related Pol polyprotein n=1 Tax=Labeo rohita TaxID=84645 RepID=A0ABQ8LA84_LABRO|nr:Retrovirus-related Pol polyprotein [Labeo rohita]
MDCFLRRDEKWENKLKHIHSTSTPFPTRRQYRQTASTQHDWFSSVQSPIPQTSVNATYQVSPSKPLDPPTAPDTVVLSGSSSFCTRPPVRLEFPTFGESCETADVFNFIEKCEDYLEVRPLTNLELLGTLSTILQGPALSWWKAEKSNVKDWESFKRALMDAFLPADYLSEVEEKLRMMEQQPNQCLRDFAYNYHALCLKWKPDASEEELVNQILNNINPRVAGCLRGTVHTVSQLVKVGALVEKDYMGAKEYWRKVESSNGKDKGKKSSETPHRKHLAGINITQHHPISSLLGESIKVNGWEVQAVMDTGSTFTLLQKSVWDKMHDREVKTSKAMPSQKFIMANGTIHHSLDHQLMNYVWHGREYEMGAFIMEDSHLAFPVIIGLDFLKLAGVVVDFEQGRYADYEHPVSDPYKTHEPTHSEELRELITTWPVTTSENLGHTFVVRHKITLTDDTPVASRAYWVSPLKKCIIEEEVDKMLEKGIIEPSFSPWSSPVVLVPKEDGTFQFCVDYRRLNKKTIFDAYPMPLIHDILESLEGATWLTFGFKAMPYGLRNAAATFQRLMERVERGGNGQRKIQAVADFPMPYDLKSLQRFLGLAGWYHRYIPHFADITAPLNHLRKKGVKWEWTEECQSSVDALKQALQHAPILTQPDTTQPFQIHTDASDVGLGAVLTQTCDNQEKVIAFASRALSSAEKNYSTSEKECLAVVWAVENRVIISISEVGGIKSHCADAGDVTSSSPTHGPGGL